MKKFHIIALLMIAHAAFSKPPKSVLRFNGMYATDINISDGFTTQMFIRFFEPDVVCSVTSWPYPESVFRCLHPDSLTQVHKGRYQLNGKSITFSTGVEGKTIDVKGVVKGKNLKLHWKSHINGKEGDRIYTFMKMT